MKGLNSKFKINVLSILFLVFYSFSVKSQTQLWGVTTEGGTVDSGVVYRTDGSGNGLTIEGNYSKSIGASPHSIFVKYNNQDYYGVAFQGGVNNKGTIYKYNPTTRELTKKIDFDGSNNGATPFGKLLLASDGKFYGLTSEGGANNFGVLFQYDPVNNVCSKKVDFDGVNKGATPTASLIQAPNGKLYGMTYMGGANDMGTLFQYDIVTNTLTKKVDFDGVNNGSYPFGNLCLGSDGRLYGVTQMGGANDAGVIFSYTYPTNIFTVKRSFSNTTGSSPQGTLFQASNGMLYGATLGGSGAAQFGVLFKFDPTNSNYSVAVNFDDVTTGKEAYGDLMQATNGMLYGFTQRGGANDMGVLFELNPVNDVLTKKFDFGSSNGERPVFGGLIEIPLTINSSGLSNVYCAGGAFSISYALTGAYESNNTFTVQLSDATGSFSSPTTIGSFLNNQDGTINGIIPVNTLAGSGYRIRVVSSNPIVNGQDNGSDITIGNPVVIANASDLSLCAGDSVILYGDGALTYLWSNSVIDSVAIFPTSTLTYTVTGTDGNNCSNSASITVDFHDLPIVLANASSTSICAGSTLTLTGDGASTYVWSNGVVDNVPFVPMSGNTYTVTGTDNNNCSNTASVYVSVNPLPTAGVYINGGTFSAIQFAATYQWLNCNNSYAIIPNEINQNFTPAINGSYAVEVVFGGCTDTSNCYTINNVAIKDSYEDLEYKVYPNPAKEILNIEVSLLSEKEATITIENMLGQVVYMQKTNQQTTQLNISTLDAGVYFVKVNTGKVGIVEKVVIE